MLPEREAMEIAADKLRTNDFAKGAGVPVPETIPATGWQGVKDASDRFGSFFLKATQGSGQNLLVRRFNPGDPGIPPKFLSGDVKAIAQRIVRGDGYGFFGLFNHGKPRAFFMHRRIREAGPDGGASTCAESVWEEDLRRQGLTLFGALGWHGVAMAEFKRDLDGEYRLLEINPKLWGSLDLAIAAGVDFPSLLVQCITEGDCEEVTSYRLGIKFQWPFPDDFSRVAWEPTALWNSLSDLFSPSTKKNLELSDPFPTVVQGCQLFLPAIKGVLRR
jgi:biotin carboxylase